MDLKFRWVPVLLSSCLLASHSGCIPAESRGSDFQDRVAIKMSQGDVRAILGPGEVWAADDGRQGEMWHFSYGSVPDAKKIVGEVFLDLFLIATVFGIVILAARSGGDAPDFTVPPAGQPLSDSATRAHFFVYFDEEGRVRGVSAIKPCHDQ